MNSRPTILFVADAVTLAHLARPAALAQLLDAERYRVILACDARYQRFVDHLPFPTRKLASLSSERFLHAAAQGRPLYDIATLRAYARDDLALLESVQPAVVVGDHRLSLSTSARIAGVPYLGVFNAYWSPYAATRHLPLPDLPFNRWLGTPLSAALFRRVWPLASAVHCRPLNRLRLDYGLPSLGRDWFRAYTDADRTLYADAVELVPTHGLPATHAYLGPVAWSPDVPLPPWWDELPTDRPLVYATMGSSGRPELLDLVLDALADLPITVVATTAAGTPKTTHANVRLIDFAPGAQLAARAELMICNGGSLTVYQALAAGKPLIGIAAHMDQHLSMACVEDAGVGVLLRSEKLTAGLLRATVQRVLTDDQTRRRAQTMAHALAAYAPGERLSGLIDEVTAHAGH